ncbi:MAG: hypothetical protein HY924_11830 [Elusimicrobia bacterium]|nr:hypothetical protein [Elusimicrobiota bacterium]
MGRFKAVLLLALAAFEAYAVFWTQATDEWASRPWSRELLIACVCLAALALAELLRRLGGKTSNWLLGSFFVVSVLLAPFLAAPFLLMRWGVPQVLPNSQGFADYPRLPEIEERLGPAFREIRLILFRYRSFMQGTDRLIYVVGSPHESWQRAFSAIQGAPGQGSGGCSPTTPSKWARAACPEPGGGYDCFSCGSGSRNHPQSHALFLSSDGKQAVLFSGTGPSFDRAVKDFDVLRRDRLRPAYRYRAVSSPSDPAHDAFYARLASTAPVAPLAAPADAAIIERCLFNRDHACLDVVLRSDPSGAALAGFLEAGIPFERLSAAMALAKQKHPAALAFLLRSLKTSEARDDIAGVAEALGFFGPEAAPAVPGLIAWADRRTLPEQDAVPAEMIGPMLRIGTDEALEYVGRCSRRPIKLEEAEAIRAALARIQPLPAACVSHLRRWIARQRELKAPNAHHLISALRLAAGDQAVEPFRPFIREMLPQPKPNTYFGDAWSELNRSLEGK